MSQVPSDASFEEFDSYVKTLMEEEEVEKQRVDEEREKQLDHARVVYLRTLATPLHLKTLLRLKMVVTKIVKNNRYTSPEHSRLINPDGGWSDTIMRMARVAHESDIGRFYTAVEIFDNECKLCRTFISTVHFSNVVGNYLRTRYGVLSMSKYDEMQRSGAHLHASILQMEYLSLPYHITSNSPSDKNVEVNTFLLYE